MKYPRSGPQYKRPSSTHYLLAIDLGKRKVGVAWGRIEDGVGTLLGARTLTCNDGPEAMAALVVDTLLGETSGHCCWVCEWPKKYDHLRARHENIEELHQVGYAIARRHPWDEMYLPGTWKGNVPKNAHHTRINRALTEEERKLMPPLREHDAWDAAGIWLFAAGRTRRGGIVI